jgi:thymidylate synthase
MPLRPTRSTYEDFMRHVHETGVVKTDRTGTGTRSVFGHQMRFDLHEGFPLVTDQEAALEERSCTSCCGSCAATPTCAGCRSAARIWDEWARDDGELGPVYGVQWRLAGARRPAHRPDQRGARADPGNPDSRRLIVSAWNVADLPKMALMPCHALFQFYVAEGRLSCQLYQRSADIFLGVPFNIASYALLTHMVAQQCDLQVGDFVWTGGDCHLYANHAEQVATQLARSPYPFPTLRIKRRPASLFDYELDDFELVDYQHHAPIKAPVAV